MSKPWESWEYQLTPYITIRVNLKPQGRNATGFENGQHFIFIPFWTDDTTAVSDEDMEKFNLDGIFNRVCKTAVRKWVGHRRIRYFENDSDLKHRPNAHLHAVVAGENDKPPRILQPKQKN